MVTVRKGWKIVNRLFGNCKIENGYHFVVVKHMSIEMYLVNARIIIKRLAIYSNVTKCVSL